MPERPPGPDPAAPRTFISYSWDDDAHKEWVKELATQLRKDGVNATLDRWAAAPGDQIPQFMERAVRENPFVIAICTPRFKERSDRRGGGVGYEGDIMTAYVFTDEEGEDKRTFIPVLRRGSWSKSAPSWLLGRARIDLSGDPYSASEYEELLRTLHDAREKAPPLGPRPDFGKGTQAGPTPAPGTPAEVPDPPKPSPNRSTVPDWTQGEKRPYVPRPGLEKLVVALFQPRPGGSIGRDGPRIVTLKAEGGMGKTRLAIECAARVADLFPDGAHFVPLATTLPTEEAVAEAIGRALDLPAQACLPATVLDHLKGRTALLVLDNYESVDDPISDPDHKVARYLIRLVAEAHGLRLLVTGRSAVKVADMERIIDLSDGMTPDEARQLFLDQARLQWQADRVLTASEEPQLTHILDLTAKIPLAIELAAAWVGHCELKEIADGLEATPLGDETALPQGHLIFDVDLAHGRHNSLTRSLDWSYNLLGKTRGPSAQALFAACGLFADSFDEPTVATVAGVAKARKELHGLLDASLIRREAVDGSTRYRLHRFTRDYALSRLGESPVAEETRRRFAAHYARLAEENAIDPNDRARYALLDKEWRNALAALRIAETIEDTASSLSMFSLGHFLQFRGLRSEVEFLYLQILAIVRRANDKKSEGVILNNMGAVYQAQGRYDEALDAYAKALDIKREFQDRVGQGQTLNNMGGLHQIQGRYDEALDAYAQDLAICREFKDRVGQGQTLENLALLSEARGDLPGAIRWARQAVEVLESTESIMALEKARRTLNRLENRASG